MRALDKHGQLFALGAPPQATLGPSNFGFLKICSESSLPKSVYQNLFSPTMFSKHSKFLSSKLVSPVLWFVKLTLSISNASKAAEECSGNCLILILLRSESLNGNEVSLGKTNLAATTATKVYVGINLDPTHPQRKHNKNKYTQRMHLIYVVWLQYLRPTPREEKDIPLYKILSII